MKRSGPLKRTGELKRGGELKRTGFHVIPIKVRRAVILRDKDTCQARGLMGVRCYGKRDPHHIWPHGTGGPDTLENLITLCRAHHSAVHDRPWDSIPLGLLKGRT